jgi:NAD+ kinase
LSNRPIVLANAVEVTVEVVSGRDASANFDMQSITAMHIGDCIKLMKSQYSVRFLHPKGWSYFDTLRNKLHWNEGGS